MDLADTLIAIPAIPSYAIIICFFIFLRLFLSFVFNKELTDEDAELYTVVL